jgi:hypothetical protein
MSIFASDINTEDYLQTRTNLATSIALTLSNYNLKKFKVNTNINWYKMNFHKNTSETRFEHIFKHFNSESEGNISVRQALVEHFNLIFEDLDCDYKHEKVFFDFITEVTQGEFDEETIVYKGFDIDTQKHSDIITYWHLPTNVLIHTNKNYKGELIIISCYVRHSEITNCEAVMNGKCAYTSLPLSLVSLIPVWFYELMFVEPINVQPSQPKARNLSKEFNTFITPSKPSRNTSPSKTRILTKICA